ncbi:MAG: hypothetical protein U5S82_23135 [Gammaproteobacteria bacterium]|nr:hypothetical protein [Gammaproteobacteria bacterium]
MTAPAPRLSRQAIDAAATAASLPARDSALYALVALLDPHGISSTWARAGLVAVANEREEAEHRERAQT